MQLIDLTAKKDKKRYFGDLHEILKFESLICDWLRVKNATE